MYLKLGKVARYLLGRVADLKAELAYVPLLGGWVFELWGTPQRTIISVDLGFLKLKESVSRYNRTKHTYN